MTKLPPIQVEYSSDYIIIFNEFGTGVNGTQDDWADKHGYQLNLREKGEKGWWYPTDESNSNILIKVDNLEHLHQDQTVDTYFMMHYLIYKMN